MGGVARVFTPKPAPAPRPAPAPTPTKAGRTSTILTGAKGLGDTDLTVRKYTLLGG